MKKRIALIVSVLIVTAGLKMAAQESWSLQRCIDYALENNIQIKQQSLNVDYGQNQLDQAKLNRLPAFSGSLSNNFNFGRSLTYPENKYENFNSSQLNGYLSGEISVWSGFTLQKTIMQRDLDLKATIHDLQKAKDDLILNIAAMYLEILFAQELTTVSEAQLEVTKLQLERTKQLVEAGSLAKGAQLEIEAQMAGEELQLVNDQNRVQLSYLNLYQLLELPVEKSFIIEKPTSVQIGEGSLTMNSMNVFKNAVLTRPEILSAQMRVESAKKQYEIANGGLWPRLSFGANYYNLYNNKYNDNFSTQLKNNKRYGLGINLYIPIFNRLEMRNNISNAKLQIADYELRLQSTKNVLLKDIEQAYTNALAALKRFMASEKAVSSTEEAFRYTEEKFNVGMVNSVEYNQSKNNLTKAQSDLLQAKYEYIFRTKILDFYNGISIKL